jgi:predicted CopG family antitoxin
LYCLKYNAMKTITIEVNNNAAERFLRMSSLEKKSVSKEVCLFLTKRRNILEIMEDMSKQAKSNGLTPEILDKLLKDE